MTSHVGLDAATQRPAWEVAEVIRRYGEAFLATHGLSAEQRRALYDLADCRTAALGGHVQRCLDCGGERIAYNSCRNRHCPKCQALARARWLEREAKLLLPVEYHHVVFTLPSEVAELALANAAVLYNALFQAASATIRDVSAHPKRLGAQVGVLMVLHTWGQNLHHHPHVHAVVTGGGLSCDNRGDIGVSPEWRSCRPGFFLPVRVLGRVFRGKYLALLRTAFEQGKLTRVGRPEEADADAFARWLRPLYAKDWVVYAKPPFGGPVQVLKYLARYTHRVAISNARLLDVGDRGVSFRYKDYADAHRSKTMTLSGQEFLRRFVQHVLPRGFVKVRHFGLLANRHREEKLKRARRLLLPLTAITARTASAASSASDAPIAAPSLCPRCGSSRIVRLELPQPTSERGADTS